MTCVPIVLQRINRKKKLARIKNKNPNAQIKSMKNQQNKKILVRSEVQARKNNNKENLSIKPLEKKNSYLESITSLNKILKKRWQEKIKEDNR